MPTRRVDDSFDEDPWEPDQDFDDQPELVPCPHCRAEIAESAEFCPHCKSYISREDVPPERPRFVRIVVVVLLMSALSGLATLIVRWL